MYHGAMAIRKSAQSHFQGPSDSPLVEMERVYLEDVAYEFHRRHETPESYENILDTIVRIRALRRAVRLEERVAQLEREMSAQRGYIMALIGLHDVDDLPENEAEPKEDSLVEEADEFAMGLSADGLDLSIEVTQALYRARDRLSGPARSVLGDGVRLFDGLKDVRYCPWCEKHLGCDPGDDCPWDESREWIHRAQVLLEATGG